MITKKQLKAENEKLKQELSTVNVLLRAYIQSNQKYQDDIELLNRSLNIATAEVERWVKIAHKADEMRREQLNHSAGNDAIKSPNDAIKKEVIK